MVEQNTPLPALAGLRARIDHLDAALIAIVAERLAVCREVAEVKQGTDTPVIQPARVRDVVNSRRQQAIEAGLFLVVLIEMIVGGRVVPGFSTNAVPGAWRWRSTWLHRGSFTLAAAAFLADSFHVPGLLTGTLALLAGAAVAVAVTVEVLGFVGRRRPDLTDAEITLQIEYGLARGYAWSVEYTDDPHPRNTYWEMYGMPMFDLQDAAGVLQEMNECRKTFPQHYIRLMAFDSTRGVESIAMSFIVNRPSREPGFGLARTEGAGRTMRYRISSYATDKPEGERYAG